MLNSNSLFARQFYGVVNQRKRVISSPISRGLVDLVKVHRGIQYYNLSSSSLQLYVKYLSTSRISCRVLINCLNNFSILSISLLEKVVLRPAKSYYNF